MTHFRIRWQRRGDHVHAWLFSAPDEDATHAQNGHLCFTEPEWQSFLRCFTGNADDQVALRPCNPPIDRDDPGQFSNK